VLRLALPTGDLRAPVAAALASVGLASEEYAAGSRALRLALPGREDVILRVFREKDIPIQIALGNYDLGICRGAWVEELHARYPQEDVTLLRPLAFGRQRLVIAAPTATRRRLGPPSAWSGGDAIRIVSEYPGLAERFARRMRLGRYLVTPVWGAAEAYPPEDADVALLAASSDEDVVRSGLEPVATVLEADAWLIASRRSLATRDLSAVIAGLLGLAPASLNGTAGVYQQPRAGEPAETDRTPVAARPRDTVRLALPDGHAQRHTAAALAAAGLQFEGYGETGSVRRPRSGIDGLEIKVIRPQDMPQQVAIGNFDLAVTGRDWLMDHRCAFPSSPVVEAVDLGLSRYGIVAAVSEDVPAETLGGALAYWRRRGIGTIRVASEYPNIADHFARTHHLGRYRIVPVNGASEAFVPEDSEILVEGSETGSSFRANRLKGIARVFESTNCVIARTAGIEGRRRELVEQLLARFRAGVAAHPTC
jgi:ATP phosphoribosyltransferase